MLRICRPPKAKATRLDTTPPKEGFRRSPVMSFEKIIVCYVIPTAGRNPLHSELQKGISPRRLVEMTLARYFLETHHNSVGKSLRYIAH